MGYLITKFKYNSKTSMKRFFVILVILTLLGCEEEPFSPKTITTTTTEGWPLEQIRLDFDNQGSVNFTVRFGTRKLKSLSQSNGLVVTLPSLSTEELAPLIVETPAGEVTVVKDFKVRPKPKVIYASSTSFAHRIPLKIVLSDWSYIKSPISDNTNLEFNRSNFWSSGYTTFNVDTMEVRNLINPGDTYQLRLNISNLSYRLDVNSEAEAAEFNKILLGSFTYKSSFQKQSVQGKVGDRINIIFNDTSYFPDQLIVNLLSTSGGEGALIYKGFDYINSSGYINAMFGSFEIPLLPAGNYSITVVDPEGVSYLAEGENNFTIIQ